MCTLCVLPITVTVITTEACFGSAQELNYYFYCVDNGNCPLATSSDLSEESDGGRSSTKKGFCLCWMLTPDGDYN